MSASGTEGPEVLRRLIEDGRGEVLLFGLTPPRLSATPEKVGEVAGRTLARIDSIDVDGVVLYDLDDESDRTDDPRPFPFSPTMDPSQYADTWLQPSPGPTVIYRSVGKYTPEQLSDWMRAQEPGLMTVFVGASSQGKQVRTSLREAMRLRRELRPDLLLGGVTIPERHSQRGVEHERLLSKQASGCSFFVSQVVYQVETAKDLASDYVYAAREQGVRPAPLIFTLSLCGSAKTLEFMRWLGVDVPSWVSNEILRDQDPLRFSLERCVRVAEELTDFCRYLELPFGFNVESVSNRKVEIEATVELARRVRGVLASGKTA